MNLHSPRRTWSCAPILLLAGCATAGRGSSNAMHTEVDRAGVVDARAQGEDEQAFRGPELRRAAYVRAVLDRNPSIESARQGWRAAIARVRQTGALEDPMVNVEVAPRSIGSSSARLGYTAMISQRLPWPGKLSLDEAVAKAESDATQSDFEGTRRELALTAALLYDEYFVAVRSLEINVAHVALMREMKGAALAQFATGRASAQDPLQAEAELTHMEHDAVILASNRDVTMAQMNELLHRDPDEPLPPPANDLALREVFAASDGKHLGDEAAAHRPEIASARLHARAEQARGERAERESYPDLNLSTSYSSMWDMPEHRWMVGLGFNLPIQLGRRAGAIDEARAARARFESEAVVMTDRSRTEVTVAFKRLEEARHVLHLFETRLIPVAREQVDAARAGFVVSRNDFVTVVGAEKNLRSVELESQVARANVDKRSAELERALGRIPGLDAKELAQ
jgi:cobalt-zinc-cadmium efflux system outer membrane protein